MMMLLGDGEEANKPRFCCCLRFWLGKKEKDLVFVACGNNDDEKEEMPIGGRLRRSMLFGFYLELY